MCVCVLELRIQLGCELACGGCSGLGATGAPWAGRTGRVWGVVGSESVVRRHRVHVPRGSESVGGAALVGGDGEVSRAPPGAIAQCFMCV
jgi:hypothetical protein